MLTIEDVVEGKNVREVRLYADGSVKVKELEYSPIDPEIILELAYGRRKIFPCLGDDSINVGNSISYAYCRAEDVHGCIYWLRIETAYAMNDSINRAEQRVKRLKKIKKDLLKKSI